jgi:hypothetical protein
MPPWLKGLLSMQQFDITLKNDKYKLYDRFALFIFLLNAAGIILTFFLIGQNHLKKGAGLITLLALMLAIITYLSASKKIKKEYYFLFATLFTSLYWVVLSFWWLGALLLLLAILYHFSKQLPIVQVSAEKIKYPSLPVRTIHWQQLNNVVIKEGLLTIDFKSNKYIQQPLEENKNMINEQEFNDFCREQLKKAST